MLNFYLFTIIVVVFFILKKEFGVILIALGVAYFLYVLPSTDSDYDTYKEAYDNATLTDDFPYFITYTNLDSEPFYLFYNSFLGVVLPGGFSFYLAVNFLICFILSIFIFKNFNKESFHYFWILLLPVILPTVFYFSPRSSISFFLILAGFIKLIEDKKILSLVFFFFGIITHSQFIFITGLILLTFFLLKSVSLKFKSSLRIIVTISLFVLVFLLFADRFLTLLISIIGFLPSADLASSKINYLVNERSGFRTTSILSIIIYPLFSYLLCKKRYEIDVNLFFNSEKYDKVLVLSLLAISFYGAAINIAYFDNPHVSGRLSRFSDYVGMGVLIPSFFRFIPVKNFIIPVILFFIILAPMLFPALYHKVNWGI